MIPAQFAGITAVLCTIFRTLPKIPIFKALPYSESWNIQNPGIHRTPLVFKA